VSSSPTETRKDVPVPSVERDIKADNRHQIGNRC